MKKNKNNKPGGTKIKGMKKLPVSGPDGFYEFYSGIFRERWPVLLDALTKEETKPPFTSGLLKPYHLSAASIASASALLVEGKTDILDMCAAPGGKTLVIASRMDEGAKLTANEFSRARRARLKKVLDEYLPGEKAGRISVTGYDGTRWSRYERACFDCILLDAPCSSERHVLSDKTCLSQWTPSRIKNLAVKQWALLSGAWLLLRPGGSLVYSTCALSPRENGEVVEKLLDKYNDAVLCLPEKEFFSNPLMVGICPEYTSSGINILPDTSCGAGPMFFSVIRKNASFDDSG